MTTKKQLESRRNQIQVIPCNNKVSGQQDIIGSMYRRTTCVGQCTTCPRQPIIDSRSFQLRRVVRDAVQSRLTQLMQPKALARFIMELKTARFYKFMHRVANYCNQVKNSKRVGTLQGRHQASTLRARIYQIRAQGTRLEKASPAQTFLYSQQSTNKTN